MFPPRALALAALLIAGPALLSAAPAWATDDEASHHADTPTSDVPTEAAPPPESLEPPREEERDRAREVIPILRDRPAPASRDAMDRARRNADGGVPTGRDRSLDALSNEDFNQVLVGARGQKVIIRETGSGTQSTRSITILDNEVTSSQGQGSRACSSVGSIGESPDCQ